MSKAKLSQFQPQRKNANKHTQRGLGMLETSIQTDGWIGAITTAADGETIAGSARLEKSATIFGIEAEPIVIESDGTRPIIVKRTDIATADTERAQRLALADNRIAQVDLSWDADVITEMLKEADEKTRGLLEDIAKENNLKIETVEDAAPQIDKAEELRVKWGVESGQLWRLGEHRIICGDCTDKAVVEKVMGGEKAALFSTDPPYGVNYSELRNSQSEKRGTTVEYDDISADTLDGIKLQEFLEKCFSSVIDYLNLNSAWYLWHAQLTQGFFAAAAAAADILIHRQIIWIKPSFILGRGDYHWKHELCFYGWRKGNRPPFYGQHNQDTVWNIEKGGGSSGGTHKNHPTQKPVELWEIPINNHTKTGEYILDPFSGSGTAIIACERLHRKCRAIEISAAYVAVAIQRWVDVTGGTPELI